jgi:hypothetical protein
VDRIGQEDLRRQIAEYEAERKRYEDSADVLLPSWRAVAAAFSWARVASALLIALLLAGVGYGAYLFGRPDVDQEALRAAAIAEGRKAGAQKGAKQGYEQGYGAARDRIYVPTYSAAYREAYASEFERADLDSPQRIQVPDPR